jgi:hypothetical protein
LEGREGGRIGGSEEDKFGTVIKIIRLKFVMKT